MYSYYKQYSFIFNIMQIINMVQIILNINNLPNVIEKFLTLQKIDIL